MTSDLTLLAVYDTLPVSQIQNQKECDFAVDGDPASRMCPCEKGSMALHTPSLHDEAAFPVKGGLFVLA